MCTAGGLWIVSQTVDLYHNLNLVGFYAFEANALKFTVIVLIFVLFQGSTYCKRDVLYSDLGTLIYSIGLMLCSITLIVCIQSIVIIVNSQSGHL